MRLSSPTPTCPAAQSARHFGADGTLILDSDPQHQRYGLLRFDLCLPPGTTGSNISSAWLVVYINSVYSPGALQWSTVQSDWTALGVSWANAPSVAPPFAGSTPVASGQQFVSLDITEQLRQWLDGGKANFGIALMAVNGGAFSLDAKESKGSAHSAWMDMDVSVAGPPGPIGPAGDPGPQGPGTQFNIVFGVLSPAARSLSVQRPSNAQRPR